MINYLAAFATAVTLAISPVLAEAKSSEPEQETVKWITQSNDAPTLHIQKPIEISGSPTQYFLSAIERNIMRKTLLKSVRIVQSGKLAGSKTLT
jgi:hypothetical protein